VSAPDFTAWSRETATQVETALSELLPDLRIAPARLHDAMRYSTLGGGKRVRAMLVYGAGALTEAPAERLRIAASAVEMIHAYSLIHDDLPCMDDDVLRRGKPTCHVEFDEATALLAGDALQSLAFQLMSEYKLGDDAAVQLRMIQIFAAAGGSRGMAGGQAIDLDAVGKTITLPELEYMHIHKTGALIRAAVMLGAACGTNLDPDGTAHLDRFGKFAGLAFQVVDDLLDVQADTMTLGKTAGKDAANNKPTYVSVLGVGQSRALAEELREEALTALEPLGPGARRLRELTDFIVLRTH